MASQDLVQVAKGDLQAAWMVLENLAVSFDQIGGAFGQKKDSPNGAERERAFLEALAGYVTPELVKAINSARMRLGRYLADGEAELLADKISYWDYAGLKKETSQRRIVQ